MLWRHGGETGCISREIRHDGEPLSGRPGARREHVESGLATCGTCGHARPVVRGSGTGSPEPTVKVKWMRSHGSRIAHAFAEIDLEVGFERIEPVAGCDRVRVDDLQEDELAERCTACLRAVERGGQ